jgi:hypothetical protein
MKKYLVPMWNYKNHKEKHHLAVIEAEDRYQAMLIAIGSHNVLLDKDGWSIEMPKEEKWHIDYNYNSYEEYLPKESFTQMRNNDKIDTINDLAQKEDKTMSIYDYMYWGDYNAQMKSLAEKALPEKWNFKKKDNYFILKNYLNYTFKKLQEENKVIETDKYCVFNTGLFSHYYKPIYVYGEINLKASDEDIIQKWFFKGFKDEYELEKLDLETNPPERADYFSDPNRLIFNWHNKVIVNNEHILDDLNTSKRLPESIKNSDTPLETLNGVIDKAIERIKANYKLAVPHYYKNKIQLLVPLCFGKDETPSVALVLDQLKNGNYLATTCLSMEMAYIDARLIARPESNWLMADHIIGNLSDNQDFLEEPTEVGK